MGRAVAAASAVVVRVIGNLALRPGQQVVFAAVRAGPLPAGRSVPASIDIQALILAGACLFRRKLRVLKRLGIVAVAGLGVRTVLG